MKNFTVADWQENLVYGEDRPIPKNLIEDESTRVVLGALKPGQIIPVHPEEKAVYQFVQGQGVMIIDGEELAVKPGTVIMVPTGAVRGVKAETELVFLAVRMRVAGG